MIKLHKVVIIWVKMVYIWGMGYDVKVSLKHHESLAKIDKTTGEITEVKTKAKVLTKDGEEMLKPDFGLFARTYTDTWKVVQRQMSSLEFACACRLALYAKAYTNSLMPLCDNASLIEKSNMLGVSVNMVGKVAKKLHDLGVYGKWGDIKEIKEGEEHKRYWVFNPYLSFNGRVIEKPLVDLFKDTIPARIYKENR